MPKNGPTTAAEFDHARFADAFNAARAAELDAARGMLDRLRADVATADLPNRAAAQQLLREARAAEAMRLSPERCKSRVTEFEAAQRRALLVAGEHWQRVILPTLDRITDRAPKAVNQAVCVPTFPTDRFILTRRRRAAATTTTKD